MPPLSQPTKPGIKRPVILFVILVVACTITLALILASAVAPTFRSSVSMVRETSGGFAAQTVGLASGKAASGRVADSYIAQNAAAYESAPSAGAAPAPMAPRDADANAGTEQRIIRNGNLSLRVSDAPAALEQAKSVATAKGGFIESSSISDSGSGPRTGYATIRVPVGSFDAAIAELKKLAVVVLDESTNASDVTMEYVDLESNLRNARAEEQSYLELLKRTGSMNDVLSVTRALAEVRGRIERLDGQKRYLESQTDDATIRVTFTEETRVEVPTRTWKPAEVVRQAFNELVRALQGLVDVLIRLVIGFVGLFIPIALIIALFVWMGWKVVVWLGKKFLKGNL